MHVLKILKIYPINTYEQKYLGKKRKKNKVRENPQAKNTRMKTGVLQGKELKVDWNVYTMLYTTNMLLFWFIVFHSHLLYYPWYINTCDLLLIYVN